MKAFGLPLLLTIVVVAGSVSAQKTRPVMRLVNVENVFVDEKSFKITFSSCGTKAGGMVLPCQKHVVEREEFLIVLKRWLGKSGFTVVEKKEDADGIVQGEMRMDDYANAPAINDPDYKKKRDMSPIDKSNWDVNAWIVNENGDRIWTIRREPYPDISYKADGKAKIEGKKLAKAIQHDFKKGR